MRKLKGLYWLENEKLKPIGLVYGRNAKEVLDKYKCKRCVRCYLWFPIIFYYLSRSIFHYGK
jgi:hypothetical protein